MSDTNVFENAQVLHLFNNQPIALIGDATGLPAAATAGSFYISLHTADPGEAGTAQTASEATYTGYARVAVARTSAGWTVTGNTAANTAAVTFPACTAGTNTILYVGIGTAASGTGYLLSTQGLNPTPGTSSIVVTSSSNAVVEFAAGALTYSKD